MKQFPTHIVTVDGVIENNKNEVLLIKNRYKNIYTVPGGQVENGENLIEALKREIQEETGALVEVNQLVCISSNTGSHQGYNGYDLVPTKVMFGFKCTYLDGALQTSTESSDVLWVPKEDVLNYIKAPFLVKRYEAYLNFNGNITYLDYVAKPNYELKLDIKI